MTKHLLYIDFFFFFPPWVVVFFLRKPHFISKWVTATCSEKDSQCHCGWSTTLMGWQYDRPQPHLRRKHVVMLCLFETSNKAAAKLPHDENTTKCCIAWCKITWWWLNMSNPPRPPEEKKHHQELLGLKFGCVCSLPIVSLQHSKGLKDPQISLHHRLSLLCSTATCLPDAAVE